MSRRTPAIRPAFAVLLLALTSLLSCGREVTGPGGRGRLAEVQLNPVFPELRLGGSGEVLSIGSVVDFASVRLVLVRTDGDTVVDRVVPFPADSTSIELRLNVVLSDAATPQGEPFAAAMRYITAAGDTVFSAGPVPVIGRPVGSAPVPPPTIPLSYVGPGANAASLAMTPAGFTGTINQQVTFSSVVRDSANAVITTVPVAYTSTDSARVRVDLRTGVATLIGARGSALIIGQTLTGPADTSVVDITPTAASIALVSGGGQSVRQGLPFPQPVRVRVNAADGIGVAGVPVDFTVLSGLGTTSQPADTTDANGFAEVTWTAGDSAGTAQLRATVRATAFTVTVAGTQLSSAPSALTFGSQPANITAGDTLPQIAIVVRDATADTVRGYNGPVELALAGGTAGATLRGYEPLTATNGVVLYTGLTVDRGGAGYRLVASIPNGGPTAQSNPFDAAPTAPAAIQLVSGAGQTVPPSTALPDSIVVRVVDRFNIGKAGVTVNWVVAAGGGSAAPTSSVTDANGRAATQWMLGASGLQQLRAESGQLNPVTVGASVQAGGGTPVLFLPLDAVNVSAGRSRPIAVFLTNPTPSPLTVNFTMRDAVATWGSASLVIPAGGQQVQAVLQGVSGGSTWGVVSSAAGTDSLQVLVDSASAFIDLSSFNQVAVGDTVRTLVILDEPAPAGGLLVTVVSTDSARVLVAPGTGRGPQEPVCQTCPDLRDATTLEPADDVRLLAPPAGTATLTIPEGQLSAPLVVLPIAPAEGEGTPVPLTVAAPGLVGTGTSVIPRTARIDANCSYCEMTVGTIDQVWATLSERLRRVTTLRVRSLDPAVAIALDTLAGVPRGETSIDAELRITGLTVGTARFAFEADGLEPDTLTLPVYPRRITTFTSSLAVENGGRTDFYVYLGYDTGNGVGYSGPLLGSVNVSVTSRDPSIVRVDRSARELGPGEYSTQLVVYGENAGTTWLDYAAPGWGSDSVEVTVIAPTLRTTGNVSQMGLGLVDDFWVYAATDDRASTGTLTATSSAPGVVRVLTPDAAFGSDGSAPVRLQALALGTATLTFAAPGYDTVTYVMQVVTPELLLGAYTSPQTVVADSALRTVTTFLRAGGTYQGAADTVRGVMRSTNPAVLVVTDSVLVFPMDSYYSASGGFRAVGPGTAQVVVDLPGATSDTSAVITVQPFRLFFPATVVQAGLGMVATTTLQRRNPPSQPVEVTLELRGPSGATLPQALDTIAGGATQATITVHGGTTLGTDTLFATAAGMGPDTILVQTIRPRIEFAPANPMRLNTAYDDIGAFIYAPNFNQRAPVAEKRFVVTSSDTAVVRVTQDTIVFSPGQTVATRRAGVFASAPGNAVLVATSLDGSVDPDTVPVSVEAPRLTHNSYGPLVMGMQQVTYPGEVYLNRDAYGPALWVHLKSSDTTIVTVPDSILLESGSYYAYLDVTARERMGSAVIEFTAAGFQGGTIPVFVTRTEVEAYTWGNPAVGARVPLELYATVPGGYTRYFTVPVPIQISVRDPGVATVDSTSVTLQPGEYYNSTARILGVAAGITTVSVRDNREAGFALLEGNAVDVAVQPGQLRFGQTEYVMAPGASPPYNTYVYPEQDVDSLWVRLRTVGGRAAIVNDSLLIGDLVGYGDFTLYGVTAGVDTLIAEGDGFRPDTIIVRVEPGRLRASTPLPVTLMQGDTAFVRMELLNFDGGVASAGPAGLTLTLAPSAGLSTYQAATATTAITIPFGQAYADFRIRGDTVGQQTITLSVPGFGTLTQTITVRARE